MTLADLIFEALGQPADVGANVEVKGVAQDSRRVGEGFVFVARGGQLQDGHAFAAEAVARGAVAVVGEAGEGARGNIPEGVPYIQVEDDKRALAKLAAAFHGRPSEALKVIGVTGTDGKTTTATMLHHLLLARYPAGLLSTAGAKIGGASLKLPGHFTTPEAPEVQEMLARFRAAGCSHAVVESSSHGFAQHRLDEVAYDLGVLTNLSPEHLDYHGTFAAYRAAKAELVRRAPLAILNADDPSLPYFASRANRVVRYGLEAPEAEWRARDVVATPGKLSWRLAVRAADGCHEAPVSLPMIGRYNVYNALAALAAAHTLGLELPLLSDRLASFPGVPGRMQVVQAEPFAVVVDFAHTAPALAKAIAALRPHLKGRLRVVLGAAGERDPNKRRPLGQTAMALADLCYFTEEDHRSEDLTHILSVMASGAQGAGGVPGETFFVIPERREAIAAAIGSAAEGDVVLLTGKGHEDTLERGSETLPWNEVEEARRALKVRAE